MQQWNNLKTVKLRWSTDKRLNGDNKLNNKANSTRSTIFADGTKIDMNCSKYKICYYDGNSPATDTIHKTHTFGNKHLDCVLKSYEVSIM